MWREVEESGRTAFRIHFSTPSSPAPAPPGRPAQREKRLEKALTRSAEDRHSSPKIATNVDEKRPLAAGSAFAEQLPPPPPSKRRCGRCRPGRHGSPPTLDPSTYVYYSHHTCAKRWIGGARGDGRVMNAEDIGPTLEMIALDACRLAIGLVEAAEAEHLRRTTGLGGIAVSAHFVRTLIAARRLRPQLLGPEFAPEPGWSVMLALYVAHLEGWPLTQAALTKAAAAPGATVHGRLAALEAQGLIERRPDPSRGRGTIVTLTDEAAARMGEYLREAREI